MHFSQSLVLSHIRPNWQYQAETCEDDGRWDRESFFSLGGYTEVGCYVDAKQRDLSQKTTSSNSMTHEKCVDFCGKQVITSLLMCGILNRE